MKIRNDMNYWEGLWRCFKRSLRKNDEEDEVKGNGRFYGGK